MTRLELAAASSGGAASGGLDAGDLVTLALGVATIVVSIALAAVNIVKQQVETRRQERAKVYAEALRAVEDYLEAPHRIKRRDGSAQARWELTESISKIKSRISFYTGWLSINAPRAVHDPYVKFDEAARKEAGAQMTEAWSGPVTKDDRQVPLGSALPQPESAAARITVLTAMQECLGK